MEEKWDKENRPLCPTEVMKVANSILWEYVLAIGVSVFLWLVLPAIMKWGADRNDKGGWEGVGVVLLMVFIYIALHVVLALTFLMVNPIRIMIKYRQELRQIMPLGRRIGTYLLVGFPIPFSLAFVFRRQVEGFFYHLVYETGKNGYVVASANYRDPQEFQDELLKRQLCFTEEHREFLNELNQKYQVKKARHQEDYYSPAKMQSLQEEQDDLYYQNVIYPGDGQKAPAYLYNSILVLPHKDGKLQYAPIGQYTMNSSYGGSVKKPFHQDYYIECKILYIDGHIYAMIGVGESRCIQECFKEHHRPFYLLLSEEERITTFFKGKYYPDGAFAHGFEHVYPLRMQPNTRQQKKDNPLWPILYPLRKVERIDLDTINAVAEELQSGILKESVAYYSDGRFEEHLREKGGNR